MTDKQQENSEKAARKLRAAFGSGFQWSWGCFILFFIVATISYDLVRPAEQRESDLFYLSIGLIALLGLHGHSVRKHLGVLLQSDSGIARLRSLVEEESNTPHWKRVFATVIIAMTIGLAYGILVRWLPT